MRELLTFIAGLLVVALTAALVGPYFVDWTAQRGFLERRLADALGARVEIDGPVSLSLLPTPSLDVGRLSISSLLRDGPSLESERASFELAVTSLIRGELQFMTADLEHPTLRLHASSDGELQSPSISDTMFAGVGFESVRLTDGSLIIERDGTAPMTIDHIDLDARADSLSGPVSAQGVAHRSQGDVAFTLLTGTAAGSSLPAQAHIAFGKALSIELTGTISGVRREGALALSYQGDASVSGVLESGGGLTEPPWSVTGALSADASLVSLSQGVLRFGPEAAALEARVDAKYGFTAGSRSLVAVKADAMDVDRLLDGLGKPSVQELSNRFASLLSQESHLAWPVDATFSTPVLTLGGKSIVDASLDLALDGAQVASTLRAKGPGDARVFWSGAVSALDHSRSLQGHLDAAINDLGSFAAWIGALDADAASRLRSLPWRSIAAQADVDESSSGWRATNLKLQANGDAITGEVSYTPSAGAQRARASVVLSSDSLDIDTLPDVWALNAQRPDADVDVSLEARAVRVAHFGQGQVDAGHISLRLNSHGDDLRLDRLVLTNVGGANLTLSGETDQQGGRLDVSADADRLSDLADLVRHAAPGPAAEAFAKRAVALSPLRLSARIAAKRAESGAFASVSASIGGEARGVRIAGSVQPAAGGSQANLELQGDDSSILMRQLGFDALPIAHSGPGEVDVRGVFDSTGAITGTIKASLAGSSIDASGAAGDLTNAPNVRGRIAFRSADAGPFFRLSTLAGVDPTERIPLSIDADAVFAHDGLALSGMTGAIFQDAFSGRATLSAGGDGALSLTGDVGFDHLDLPGILTQIVGSPSSAAPGDMWSNAPFEPRIAAPPRTDVLLHAKTFSLAPMWSGGQADFHLTVAPDRVAVQDLSMALGGGGVKGSLDIRRDGGAIAATGLVKLSDVAFSQPIFSGRLTGDASFATTGASDRDLALGLAGSGALRMQELRIDRSSPDALSKLLSTNVDDDGPRQIALILSDELNAGPLVAEDRAFDLQLAGGQLKLASKEAPDATTLVFDARDFSTLVRMRVTAPRPKDWPNQTDPAISVVWKAPAPGLTASRSVEADAVIGALSERAAARAAEHLAELNQDIQERAFFERRMKGLAFMRRRSAEVAAWIAEQKMLRKAAEAAARAAQSVNPAPLGPLKSSGSSPAASNPRNAAPAPPDPLASGRF